MFEILHGYLAEFTYAGIFLLLLLCGLGLPVPEDIPIIISGYLAHLGAINVWAALGVNMGGILIGDLFIYSFGYWMGPRAAQHPLLRPVMTPERMERVDLFFSRHGRKAVFFGRFVAGIRAPLFLAAGVARMPVRIFFLMDLSAAVITVPVILLAAYYFGEKLDAVRQAIGTAQNAVMLAVALGVIWYGGRYLMRRWRERGMKTAA